FLEKSVFLPAHLISPRTNLSLLCQLRGLRFLLTRRQNLCSLSRLVTFFGLIAIRPTARFGLTPRWLKVRKAPSPRQPKHLLDRRRASQRQRTMQEIQRKSRCLWIRVSGRQSFTSVIVRKS